MDLILTLSLVVLALNMAFSIEVATGGARIGFLKDVPVDENDPPPKVSVVIPACNEAGTIEPALASVLAMDYEDMEVIVVNDRSTDDTGAILGKMEAAHDRLTILQVTELPEGWLGKSHALQCGAESASGDYLLFTDADVAMERTTLRRAMAHVTRKGLDHLSLLFRFTVPGGLLNAFIMDVGGHLMARFKPWKAKDPKSRYYMGVGAFNLVRADAYRQSGKHRPFAMHPIDDILLGKNLKKKGFRQDCLYGYGFISVQWYSSLTGAIEGLRKNSFALFDYSVAKVAAGIALSILITIVPLPGVLLARGWPGFFFGAAVLFRVASFAIAFRVAGLPVRYALWSLLSSCVGIYTVLNAAFTTIRNGGITWRGTHYALEELKAVKVQVGRAVTDGPRKEDKC